jgi:hypothetical protein
VAFSSEYFQGVVCSVKVKFFVPFCLFINLYVLFSLNSRSCCPIMWDVVAAYAGERSLCINLNWLFLGAGVVLPKLHHYFVKLSLGLFTSYMLRRNRNMGNLC